MQECVWHTGLMHIHRSNHDLAEKPHAIYRFSRHRRRTCKIQKRHRRGELAGDAHTLMMPGQFGPIILVLVDMFRALFTTTISCMEWKFYDFRNTCMRHQVLAATLSLGCLR